MSEHPNTARGDVAYWGLPPWQASRYHSRLARMHAKTSRRYADEAVRLGRISTRYALIGGVLAGLVIVKVLAEAVFG